MSDVIAAYLEVVLVCESIVVVVEERDLPWVEIMM